MFEGILKSGDLVVAVLTTVGTLFAGYLTTYLSKKNRKEKVKDEKKQIELVKTFEEQLEVRKLEILKEFRNDLPEGTNFNDILYAISAGPIEIPIKRSNSEDNTDEFEGLISSYHNQALSQSNIQFWFSIFAAVAGFVLIVYMIMTVTSTSDIEYITRSFPGVMVELVAGLFFKQATDTRKRATDYFDKLRSDKQIARGIVIANSIEDNLLKSITKSQIALSLSGIDCEKIDLLNVVKAKE